MKKLLPTLVLLFLLASCNNSADKAKETEEDTVETVMTRLIWQAGLNDSTGRLEMKQVPATEPGELTVPDILDYINHTNPEITLTHIKNSGDTVYLRIADATYLTQRMGSSGPEAYLATVVYNLTDLPGVQYVNMDFEEGDHASPGTFSRDTFKND